MLKHVKNLVKVGFAPVALKGKSKRPRDNGWTNAPRLTFEEFSDDYIAGDNIGVRLGKPSKIDGRFLHVLDMDIRDEEFVEEAREVVADFLGVDLDTVPTVISGSGGESRHFYFLADTPFPSKKLWKSEETIVGEDGVKHRCAEVELFGTGKQVVLPPSIHPDTGKAYRWEYEFDVADLPVVENEVIEEAFREESANGEDAEPLGISEEEAKEALETLQAWADDRDTWVRAGMALKHEFGKDGWPIFDKWSKRGRGYNREENWTQWKSFKNERGSVVTMATVIGAAHEVEREARYANLEEEFEDLPEEEEPRRREKPKTRARAREDDDEDEIAEPVKLTDVKVPANLLRIPGVLQRMVEYFNATSMKDQPQFAVQAALAFGSVVLGRTWRTDQDNYSSLFFLSVGPTSSGKEHVKKTIERVLDAAGLEDLIGFKNYTSEAGLLSGLIAKPKHVSSIDEFGRYLGSARAQGGNAMKNEAQSAIMEAYGRCDGIFTPISYSTASLSKDQAEALKNRRVRRPALTISAMTTGHTLFGSLSESDVKDGFLNRFIAVESTLGRRKGKTPKRMAVPKDLIKWARECAFASAEDDEEEFGVLSEFNQAHHAPPPIEVPFARGCLPILSDIEDEVLAEQDRLDAVNPGMGDLWGRTRENAMRLSLIVAVSEDYAEVLPRHLKWAWEYVSYYQRKLTESFVENVGRTPLTDACESVVEVLRKHGEPMTQRDMARQSRKFQAISQREHDEFLMRLKRDYGVIETKEKAKNGATVFKYHLPKKGRR